MRLSLRTTATAITSTGVALAMLLAFATTAQADYTVNACGSYPNNLFVLSLPADGSIMTTRDTCPAGGHLPELNVVSGYAISVGDRGAWQANAPAGLEIVGATVPNGELIPTSIDGSLWTGGPYWKGGSANVSTTSTGGSWSGFASPYFGFQLICGPNPCEPSGESNAQIWVGAVSLTVHETVGPSFSAPSGLWQAKGWVRGAWPLDFSGDSPSGVCALSGTLNGLAFIGTSSPPPNSTTWHQCSAPPVSTTINTAAYGQGPVPLVIAGTDAAGNVGSTSKTVQVDNTVPTLSLSGPSDAPSTAGTQLVTATAGGSPSGISQVVCSVDGGPAQAYPGAVAHVPVGSGLGEHQVSCTADNNAADGNGVHGASQTQTRSIKIGTPTVLRVTFLKHTRIRVVVPVPLKRHGELVKRHGKVVYRTRVEHRTVVVRSRKVTQRVGHGRATTVSGRLGLADGAPLGGQTVEVLTAPDNETGRFEPAVNVITGANGSWTASLPAGPSRLIEASYAGGATTERSTSRQATLLVPARVELTSVTPRLVAWGQTVTIKGRLLDGYLPDGGVNVRLRIGIASAKTTFGVKEHVAGTGSFTATFTFGPGPASLHRTYWFQIASLPAGDYPWTASASNRIYVHVGGHL